MKYCDFEREEIEKSTWNHFTEESETSYWYDMKHAIHWLNYGVPIPKIENGQF